jgi:hypothetical protein
MQIRWLKFVAWSAVAAVVCWCYAFAPGWRFVTTLFLAAVPLILWRTRQFQEQVHPFAMAVAVAAVAFLVVASFSGWTQSSNEWFGRVGLRPMAAALVWLVLTLAGYHALIKQPAA